MTIIHNPHFANLSVSRHPLILHKLGLLRDKNTSKKLFKELVGEITSLLVYEATKDLPTEITTVETPLQTCEVLTITKRKPVIVPIMRAGIGMVDAFL